MHQSVDAILFIYSTADNSMFCLFQLPATSNSVFNITEILVGINIDPLRRSDSLFYAEFGVFHFERTREHYIRIAGDGGMYLTGNMGEILITNRTIPHFRNIFAPSTYMYLHPCRTREQISRIFREQEPYGVDPSHLTYLTSMSIQDPPLSFETIAPPITTSEDFDPFLSLRQTWHFLCQLNLPVLFSRPTDAKLSDRRIVFRAITAYLTGVIPTTRFTPSRHVYIPFFNGAKKGKTFSLQNRVSFEKLYALLVRPSDNPDIHEVIPIEQALSGFLFLKVDRLAIHLCNAPPSIYSLPTTRNSVDVRVPCRSIAQLLRTLNERTDPEPTTP